MKVQWTTWQWTLWHFIGSKIWVEQARAGHIIISGIRLIALLIFCKLLTEQEWLLAGLCPCWCQRGKSGSHLFKSLAEWRRSLANDWENMQKRLLSAYGGRFFIKWMVEIVPGVKQDIQERGWKAGKEIIAMQGSVLWIHTHYSGAQL